VARSIKLRMTRRSSSALARSWFILDGLCIAK
jgi:hypothetical protein